MTETTLRKRARELLKPLFLRPCSVEERAVCDAVESFIERQQQVIDTLVEALRPFAALTACLECVVPSTETVTIEVRQGDLVGALAAVMLAEAKQNPNRAREAKVEAERILDHSHPGLKREE